MSGIFIDGNETLSFDIYVGLDALDKLYASATKEELLKDDSVKDETIMSYNFEFRVPNYKDNMDFFSRSVKTDAQGEFEINPSLLRYERFISLLNKWSLDVKPTKENVDKLNPIIADVVMTKLEELLS